MTNNSRSDVPPLLELYYETSKQAVTQYGKRTIVLFMVGSFYEVYESPDGQGQAKVVSEICHLILTRKNKNIAVSSSNPFLCGFPTYALSRHVTRLIDHKYTVVVWDQDNDKKTERKLRCVYSPSVHGDLVECENEAWENLSKDQSETIMGIHLLDGGRILCLVMIDLKTGRVSGVQKYIESVSMIRVELYKSIQEHRPCEVIAIETIGRRHDAKSGGFECTVNMWKEHVTTCAGVNVLVHWRETVPKEYTNHAYQSTIFEKAYPQTGDTKSIPKLTIHENLHIEYYQDWTPLFAYVINFLYGHHPLTIHQLKKPEMNQAGEEFFYNEDLVRELNIFEGDPSIWTLINHTCTPMGERGLRQTLWHPQCNGDVLNRRYDDIETMKAELVMIRKHLSVLDDMEILWRRLKCFPQEKYWKVWRETWKKVQQLEPWFVKSTSLWKDIQDMWTWWMQTRVSQTEQRACFPECLLREYEEEFQGLQNEYDTSVGPHMHILETIFQMTMNERAQWKDGQWMVVINKKEWKLHGQMLEGHGWKGIVKTTSVELCLPTLEPFFREWFQKKQNLLSRHAESWRCLLSEFTTIFDEAYTAIVHQIIEWDKCQSFATCAEKYGYTRPHVLNKDDTWKLQLDGVRHPLVETIIEKEPYSPFHVEWSTTEKRGLLLYGHNSSGKSTLLKSVGLALWMAQCGSFVACQNMTFQPFRVLCSKIDRGDNLFKGQSTFVSEMMDIRLMMNTARPGSMFLCDELTSGTETCSATGLVAACIKRFLNESNVFFFFTTHLHTLYYLKDVFDHSQLRVCHVPYRSTESTQRILCEGIAPSYYGIEMAQQLALPDDFIRDAYHFREQVQNLFPAFTTTTTSSYVSGKPSRYNSKLIVQTCEKCQRPFHLQTHHKIPQSQANSFGYLKTFHKNVLHNLQVLCVSCHEQTHRHEVINKDTTTTTKLSTIPSFP